MILKDDEKIKITYVFTHHIRWVPFELNAKYIDKNRFEIDYIILGENDPIINFLREMNIPCTVTAFNDYKDTPEAIKFVYDYLTQHETHIVQTHWFAGSLVGMQAAYYARVPVRIFHREHPPLQYYNRHPSSKHRLIWDCATHVIAVTNKSKQGMIEDGIPEDKITVIPTGFDIEEFENVNPSRVAQLKTKYLGQYQDRDYRPIIGVVARYVKWKGIEYVIQAHKQVLKTHPNALLILAGTHIDRTALAEKMQRASKEDIVAPQYDDVLSIIRNLEELPEDSYIEIPFEEDLFSLFQLFDIFVHAPTNDIQETFGQVYVEAMLAKVPSVITLSGSALDHAVHQENAWVVDYRNSDQIAEGILELLENGALREKIKINASLCAKQRYAINDQVEKLQRFYIRALEEV